MRSSKELKYLVAFGNRVAKLRRERGITQEQLAEHANMAVLSIGAIEQGRRWPRIDTLHKLAKGLGVSVDDMFRGLRP